MTWKRTLLVYGHRQGVSGGSNPRESVYQGWSLIWQARGASTHHLQGFIWRPISKLFEILRIQTIICQIGNLLPREQGSMLI